MRASEVCSGRGSPAASASLMSAMQRSVQKSSRQRGWPPFCLGLGAGVRGGVRGRVSALLVGARRLELAGLRTSKQLT